MEFPLRALRSFLGVLLTVTLVLALAGEGLLRLIFPCPFPGYRFEPPQRGWFEHDPLLGWRGRPSASGIFAGPDYRVTVTHNERGHRGSAPLLAPGRRSVIAVGDSYAWGWGVEDEEVFSERMMRSDPGLDVYNLSAPGYGTDQEYLALGELLKADPRAPLDAVVVLLSATDFDDVAMEERYRYPKPRFVLAGEGVRLVNTPVPQRNPEAWSGRREPTRLERSAWNRFHLYNLVRNRLRPLRPAAARPREAAAQPREAAQPNRPPRDPQELRRALEVCFRLLRGMEALAARHGAALLVVLLELDPDPRWEPLSRLLADEGIRTTRFVPGRLPRTRLWLDRHLNARGHRQLARHVREALFVAE